MGLFDTIIIKCPHCNGETDIQTKAGDCMLQEYDRFTVPVSIAYFINDVEQHCVHCDGVYKVSFELPKVATVVGSVSKIEPDSKDK
jgi:hypothetical protein